MAAPVLQTSSETASNVFTKPSGVSNGEGLYILYWSFHGSAGDPSAPSGFTSVGGTGVVYSGANRLEARVYRKIITNAAGEPASYTVTRGGGTNHADGGEIFRVSGLDTTTPENTTTSNTGSASPASSGSFTTTNAECLLLMMVTVDTLAPGTPSGMTQQFNQDGGDARGYSETLAAIVSGVTRDSTLSGSAVWATGLVAIQPPPPAPAGIAVGTPTWDFPHPPMRTR